MLLIRLDRPARIMGLFPNLCPRYDRRGASTGGVYTMAPKRFVSSCEMERMSLKSRIL